MTRSLSNLIKAGFFRVDKEDTLVIDSDKKIEKFMPEIFQAANSAGEFAAAGEFREGLQAVHVEMTEQEEEVEEETENSFEEEKAIILEQAREEANSIIASAQIEAEQQKKQAYEMGKVQGYEEGKQLAEAELTEAKQQLETERTELQMQYEQQIAEVEPQFAILVAELVEKMTGVIAEERQEVITYLIQRGLKQTGRSKNIVVVVSEEDFEFVNGKKEMLMQCVGKDCMFDIIEDRKLTKNQCLIETEGQSINCSLDIQLHGLIEDLRLLAEV